MKTLKDVYIKVTEKNFEELHALLNRKIRVGYYLYFLSDDISTSWLVPDIEENKQKVSLTELKRLIEAIPTREEIKRLKQQISGYKTRLLLTNERCKELQSDNNILNSNLSIKNNKICSLKDQLTEVNSYWNKEIKDLKQLDFYKSRAEEMTKQRQDIYKLYEDLHIKTEPLHQMYNDALLKIDKYEEQKKVTDNIIHSNHAKIDHLQHRINVLIFDLNRTKERLKNKKWYQIWK